MAPNIFDLNLLNRVGAFKLSSIVNFGRKRLDDCLWETNLKKFRFQCFKRRY